MRTVLLLAYQFPPIGGAGVLRALKLAQYLPEHGYRPIIVTGPGRPDFWWTPEDRELLASLGEVRIERLETPEPDPPAQLRRRLERVFDRWGDIERWWVIGAEEVGRRVGAPADLILCELGPYETADAAAQLSRDLGIPWVADLQDPWALDEMWLYPSEWHLARDRRRMRRILGSAGSVIMNTDEARARASRAFPELAGPGLVAIPNGFDPADFADPPPTRKDAAFRIVHTGTLHTAFALYQRRAGRRRRLLGGMPVPGTDYLTRSHAYLLRALDELVSRQPALAGSIELHLAGVLTDEDRYFNERAKVRVVEHAFVSHRRSIELVRSADLLFLPMQQLPDGARAGLVPAKTYEYVASGVPILAAVPPGDARDLLDRACTATIVEPDDSAGMRSAIEALLGSRAERPALIPPPDVLAEYAWPRLVQRIAELLDATLERSVTALPTSPAFTYTETRRTGGAG
jgi:glycosyltransferase involved in cell wall biosynthesis